MNYQQTLSFLYDQLPMFQRIGGAAYKADLKTTEEICNLLGNPENSFPSIHVAGTNGKGSVSHLLASVLQSAGYKTGLYTSPHLKDFRERIRINGQMIPKSYVTRFVSEHREILDSLKPSFFEYTVALAFKYFSEQQLDVAVIEVGMGGRLDSTNVITPLVSVITNISMDHSAFLGNTLKLIAAEKAGIIKTGVPVIIGETQEEVKDVFLEKARKIGANLVFADQNFSQIPNSDIQYLSFKNKNEIIISNIDCPLKGNYQKKNFISVLQTIDQLRLSGKFIIDDESIRNGFKDVIRDTGLRGRWEILSENPKIICDVGHNEAGILEILESLKNVKYQKLHWVLGMVNDKDIEHILQMLPKNATYYFCKADIPRGLDTAILSEKAHHAGLKGKSYESVKDAYLEAKKNAKENDLVFAGGSTFTVAEIL